MCDERTGLSAGGFNRTSTLTRSESEPDLAKLTAVKDALDQSMDPRSAQVWLPFFGLRVWVLTLGLAWGLGKPALWTGLPPPAGGRAKLSSVAASSSAPVSAVSLYT